MTLTIHLNVFRSCADRL